MGKCRDECDMSSFRVDLISFLNYEHFLNGFDHFFHFMITFRPDLITYQFLIKYFLNKVITVHPSGDSPVTDWMIINWAELYVDWALS